jgi:hypothetical protein
LVYRVRKKIEHVKTQGRKKELDEGSCTSHYLHLLFLLALNFTSRKSTVLVSVYVCVPVKTSREATRRTRKIPGMMPVLAKA